MKNGALWFTHETWWDFPIFPSWFGADFGSLLQFFMDDPSAVMAAETKTFHHSISLQHWTFSQGAKHGATVPWFRTPGAEGSSTRSWGIPCWYGFHGFGSQKIQQKKKLRSRKFGAATKITWSDYKERTWRIRFDTATLQGLFLIFLIFDHVSIRSQSPFDELTTDSCETDGWIAVHPKKLGFGRMLKTWLKEVVPTLEHLRWGCHTWLWKWNMWRPGATPSSTFFFSHTVREWHGIATNI